MTFIKKQLSLWRIVLVVGVAAIAIPIAARVSPTARADVKASQDCLDHQTTAHNEDGYSEHSKDSKAAVGLAIARPQDDYYDRRREYWERRVERRLDHEEDMDEDDEDAKDSKAGKDDDDDEDEMDRHEEELERRRDYWRKRLDDEW
jgi:hypothetical protein